MNKYIFVPYDPAFAEIREFDNDIEAIDAFAKWAADETSLRAHLVNSEKNCIASMGDGVLATDAPLEAFMSLEDDGVLAQLIENTIKHWLFDNIDYAVPHKVVDDLVDELFAAGFQNSVTMAWPTVKQYLASHSFVSEKEES